MNKTEEYAIVDVIQIKKSTYIRLTIGEETAKEEVWKEEKTDFPGDFSPVIKKLNALNVQGFEVVNESLTYTTTSYIPGGTQQAGNAFHSFLLRKKL